MELINGIINNNASRKVLLNFDLRNFNIIGVLLIFLS